MIENEKIGKAKEDFALSDPNTSRGFILRVLIFERYARQKLHIMTDQGIADYAERCISEKAYDTPQFYLWYYQHYLSGA